MFQFFSKKEIIKSKVGKVTYTIICKHPMGYSLKFNLDKFNWDNSYNNRNSVWRFNTTSGLTVRLSGPCYTDSSMKIVK